MPWAAEFSGLSSKQVFGPLCKATNRLRPDLLIYGRCIASTQRSAATATATATATAINSSTSPLAKALHRRPLRVAPAKNRTDMQNSHATGLFFRGQILIFNATLRSVVKHLEQEKRHGRSQEKSSTQSSRKKSCC